MTIRVTLQQNGKCTRKEYRTHKRAVLSIKRWFAASLLKRVSRCMLTILSRAVSTLNSRWKKVICRYYAKPAI